MKQLEPKKGNMIVYLVLLVFTIICLVYACNKSKSGDISPNAVEIAEGKQPLRVAMQISPMGVNTAGDTLSGFYYDMLKEMAACNGFGLRIQGYNRIQEGFEMLNSGEVDMVAGDIPITAQLRENYLFTEPIYADRQVLVQLRDSVTGQVPYSRQSDLRGGTVYLAADSPFLKRVRNLSHEIGDTIYTIQENLGPEQLMLRTAMGEIPNVVVNEKAAEKMVKDYPQLDASLTISFKQFQAWALRKSEKTLLDSINSSISRFTTTPSFNALLEKYNIQ